MFTFAHTAFPENAEPVINRNLINLVAVGYDIENSPVAQKMLHDMAQAAKEAGAVGEVIMAGQDQEQLDQAMQQAMSIAIGPATPPKPEYRLELKTLKVTAGEMIVVLHSEFPTGDRNAWIAFYEKTDDRDQDYIYYTFLANLTDRTYDIIAPDKPGNEYHFRLFKGDGYDCVARSAQVTISETR